MELIVIISALLFYLFSAFQVAVSENLLQAVAIQYKVRSRNPDDYLEFKYLLPYEKTKEYEFIAEERYAFQPTAIVKNVSDRQLNFMCRYRIINTKNNRIIYNRLVPVSTK